MRDEGPLSPCHHGYSSHPLVGRSVRDTPRGSPPNLLRLYVKGAALSGAPCLAGSPVPLDGACPDQRLTSVRTLWRVPQKAAPRPHFPAHPFTRPLAAWAERALDGGGTAMMTKSALFDLRSAAREPTRDRAFEKRAASVLKLSEEAHRWSARRLVRKLNRKRW
jgi:hypothetical protein